MERAVRCGAGGRFYHGPAGTGAGYGRDPSCAEGCLPPPFFPACRPPVPGEDGLPACMARR
ncbi:hypothetical protein CT154_08800 [Komagataeibacter xylinus]|nr:hypothetical protein CT154_08800 [Komagataeibacter xylinus]